MGKNIVLLSDGTGNSAANLHKTNVWRVYRALSTDNQLYEYDDGVGTSSLRPLALLSGAVGLGLARNVRHLYAFLSRNYSSADDDKVFAFGFSRGAFTIRMLIGLVRNQGLVNSGLPEESFQREVLDRWTAFRKSRFRRFGLEVDEQRSQNEVKAKGRIPSFEFVGNRRLRSVRPQTQKHVDTPHWPFCSKCLKRIKREILRARRCFPHRPRQRIFVMQSALRFCAEGRHRSSA